MQETRFAERIVRDEAWGVRTTILRPSITVGDSATGEIDRLDGPYLPALLMLNSPVGLRMPVPPRRDPAEPGSYRPWSKNRIAIARDVRSVGARSTSRIPIRLLASRVRAHRRCRGQATLRGFLLRTSRRRSANPGRRSLRTRPRAFLEQLATEVVYDDRNTREVLAGLDMECPGFESYVQLLVDTVRAHQAEKRRAGEREAAVSDPLA